MQQGQEPIESPSSGSPSTPWAFHSRRGEMGSIGQIFNRETQAIFYNWKPNPVQRMLDFDFLCGELAASYLGALSASPLGYFTTSR